ncbi:MAG: hypothetical protein IT294_09335 [Deltaproteobacteria bacterium]|nr:hypothetical protein [Deltaproteobacteria bacterium]
MSLARASIALACALLLAACGGAGSASDGGGVGVDEDVVRSFALRWRSSPDAAGYIIHWGAESGVYREARDIGSPEADADGVSSYVLEHPGGASGVVYFALRSYDASYSMSAFSNEIAVVVR